MIEEDKTTITEINPIIKGNVISTKGSDFTYARAVPTKEKVHNISSNIVAKACNLA